MSSLVSFLLTFSLLLAVPSLMAQDGPGKAKAKRPNPAMVPVEDIPGLPRVLLIGDSISIGYTLPTREALAGIANVHRPRANCGPTTSGLANLAEWLKTGGEEKNWDVIHFNWGLHDLKYMGPNGENLADPDAADSAQQVPPDEYRENLETLVGQLLETGASLIWRNTTPVPEGAQGRVVGDSAAYNGIAAEVMKAKGIPTHDLFAFTQKRQEEVMRPANVHFTPEGSEALGQDVARVINQALAWRSGASAVTPGESGPEPLMERPTGPDFLFPQPEMVPTVVPKE